MNVLLVTTDQQRADTLGAYGSRLEATPHLDRFAAAGVRFDLCRTQNPYCQPSRATILTGRYPSSHGVHSNGVDFPAAEVGTTLSATLAAAGWTTAFRGKAHFASTYPRTPTGALESVEGSAAVPADWRGPYMGFTDLELVLFGHHIHPGSGRTPEHWGPPPRGLHYARFLFRDGEEAGRRRLRLMGEDAALRPSPAPETWASALPEEDHPTTWVADRTIDFLRTVDRRRPWFCWTSFTDPHHPMDPPAPWCDRYRAADMTVPARHPEEFDRKPPFHRLWAGGLPEPMRWANPGGMRLTDRELAEMMAGYYGMVAQLDHAVGRVLAALAETGQADDTLVVVTTDHGELLGDHQLLFKGPLHYDGLLRVPLLVRGPGVRPGVVGAPVGTIDLAPTILDLVGLPIPATVEGRSLRPFLAGGSEDREWVLTENDHEMGLPMYLRTLTTERWVLTRWDTLPGVGELYDRRNDPGELENRWDDAACAGVRRDLLALLGEVANPSPRRLFNTGSLA
ncbi:MAG TPA: sulfatase-like hydrolase/transferase [Candidatus Binatia bacterium]|nr:sulfatase-like hydrolase/transferase [Candidatus Binatia bacterium]